MAMIDYGAIVKKNGVIITKKDDDIIRDYTNIKDENHPMKGMYMALIGDNEFTVGFYKTGFMFAYDAVLANSTEEQIKHGVDIDHYEWFENHLKPMVTTGVDKIGTFTIEMMVKDRNLPQVFLAKFSYKGDDYEVLFGYGVDPDPGFMCNPKCSYWSTWWRRDWHTCTKTITNKNKHRHMPPLIRAVKDWYYCK